MTCADFKRIRGRDWPLFRAEGSSTCIYKVETPTANETADVAAAASEMDGYVRRSRFYAVEKGVRVYLAFRST